MTSHMSPKKWWNSPLKQFIDLSLISLLSLQGFLFANLFLATNMQKLIYSLYWFVDCLGWLFCVLIFTTFKVLKFFSTSSCWRLLPTTLSSSSSSVIFFSSAWARSNARELSLSRLVNLKIYTKLFHLCDLLLLGLSSFQCSRVFTFKIDKP